MKKILAAVLAICLWVPLAYAQPKTVNILKADIDLNMSVVQKKISFLNKALGYLLPSQAWATSCVGTNDMAGTVLSSLVAADTAGLNSGKMLIRDASHNLLATLNLNATVGTVATNVLTFNTIADATATGTGDAAEALITNNSGTTFFTVDVGTSGKTIIISNVAIATNDTIHVTSVPTITLNLGS